MKPRRWAFVGLALLLAVARVEAAPPATTDSEFTALFVRYYGALKKERWGEAFGLLHERLKQVLQVQTPHDLAVRNYGAQRDLSIKGTVSSAGDGNVAGEVVYDLMVFPKGPGRPLMYRVIMDVGLAQGQIIRLTQHSITRIDPGRAGDVM